MKSTLWMPYGPPHLLRTAWARGAWDYLKTPWDLDELEVRAARLLKNEEAWESGGLLFELKQGSLFQGERRASLGAEEFSLLKLLLQRRGVPLSPALLEQAVWREAKPQGSKALAMLISRLRKKFRLLGWDKDDPIPSDRLHGYRLP